MPQPNPQFNTTRWSLVLAGRRSDQNLRRSALNELLENYWYPLYAYLRRHGKDPAAAEDLTQSFLAMLIEKNAFAAADPARGRFRTFLLASLKNFTINEHAAQRAEKRGGGRQRMSLDISTAESRYSREPSHDLTPEKLFERRWALTLLEQVLKTLEIENERTGKKPLFDALKPMLTAGDSEQSHAQIGAALGMNPDAVKTAALRLRRRYRDLLREHITDTVDSPAEVDDELNHLIQALS